MRFKTVSLYDDVQQVARLLYYASISAHRAWQGSEADFVELIQPWLYAKNSLYYYKNLHVAIDDRDRFPLALIGGAEPTKATKFDFNYSDLSDHTDCFIDDFINDCPDFNRSSEHAVHNYLNEIVGWQHVLPKEELLITVFCVDPALCSDEIGFELLVHYIHSMRDRGYTTFRIDCNADDQAALQQYAKLDFQKIGESLDLTHSNGETRLANLMLRL